MNPTSRFRAALNIRLLNDAKREAALAAIHQVAPQSPLMQNPTIAASYAALTTKVKSKLMADSNTRPYSIHVESDQGTVTLDGTVDSPSKAKYVETVVASVDGVQAVNNKLSWPTSQAN